MSSTSRKAMLCRARTLQQRGLRVIAGSMSMSTLPTNAHTRAQIYRTPRFDRDRLVAEQLAGRGRRGVSTAQGFAPTTQGGSVPNLTSSKRIDGKVIADELLLGVKDGDDNVISNGVKQDVEEYKARTGRTPGLAVLLVGDRKDSKTYVGMKVRACKRVGITSEKVVLPESITEEALLAEVDRLNKDTSIDGILVQMPLPPHIDERRVVTACSPDKDVDGLHPVSAGRLLLDGASAPFIPCTPKGIMELIKSTGCEIEGKHAVVLGRSILVGKPVALLLQAANATVTMCHSRTQDLPSIVRQADILVAAVGRTEMVKGDWIKPGAVVIDVGINAVDDASAKRGYRLVGDVDFESASKVAGHITPVPGGVGPMTIAMLMKNTLTSAMRTLVTQKST